MPLKRKDRPESWSSNASSPEEKRTREKNHSALESESEDDILKALNMADNLGSKVDLILNELNKLDSIELRLENLTKSVASREESFAIIEKDVEALKEKTKKTSQKVNDLEESVDYNDQDISDLQRDVKGLQHEVDNLKMQLLYQEHYSRRENLMFIGIQEEVGTQGDEENSTHGSNQNTENTKEIIYNFMKQELQIQNARSRIEFQRVHRVGKERGKKSRPIIAKFLRYCDREDVLFKARKLLKDKSFSVFEDMPKELYELRKAQLKKLQNAKQRGDTAYFSKKYPDKLFINGKFIPLK